MFRKTPKKTAFLIARRGYFGFCSRVLISRFGEAIPWPTKRHKQLVLISGDFFLNSCLSFFFAFALSPLASDDEGMLDGSLR